MDGMLRVKFNFFAQPANIYVHAARRDESLGAPYGIEQLVASEYPVRPRRQKIEQTEFQRAHGHRFGGSGHAIGCRINAQRADFNWFFGRRARLSAAIAGSIELSPSPSLMNTVMPGRCLPIGHTSFE